MVMRLQRKCACGAGSGGACRCGAEQRAPLRRKAGGPGAARASAVVDEVLRSPGSPLAPDVRQAMEERLGHDFSRVRIHSDARAAESARAVGALAYTVASDVVWGAGRPPSSAAADQRLLAHELVHTLQAAPAVPGPLRVSEPGDAAELEADRLSLAPLQPGPVQPFQPSAAGHPGTLHRQEAPKGAASAVAVQAPTVQVIPDLANRAIRVVANGNVGIAEIRLSSAHGAVSVVSGWDAASGKLSVHIKVSQGMDVSVSPKLGKSFPNALVTVTKVALPQPPVIVLPELEGVPRWPAAGEEAFVGGDEPEEPAPTPRTPPPAAKGDAGKKETEEGGWASVSEWVHGALDVAGLIPAAGAVPDLANAAIYLIEGRYVEAGASGIAAIPFLGEAATVGKWVAKGTKELAEQGGKKLLKEGGETLLEKGGKEAAEAAPRLAPPVKVPPRRPPRPKATGGGPRGPKGPKKPRTKVPRDRPRLPTGAKAPRKPWKGPFKEGFRGAAVKRQQEILELAKKDPQTAGRQYQQLVAEDLHAADVQEMFKWPGRRMDIGTQHEVTIEGMTRGFSSSKLDQIWSDLKRNAGTGGSAVMLTVPRLSPQAADQLRRLWAQAEATFGKEVFIIVRETL